MSGSHRSGSHRAGGGSYRPGASGGYGHAPEGSRPSAGGPYGERSGGSGPYGERPGGGSGPYGERPGGSGSGPYRGGSGSHRIVHNRPPRRRVAVVLIGAVAGVAACILAVFVVLGALSSRDDSGRVTNSGASTPDATGPANERTIVPDACEMVSEKLAGELAPNADRTQSDTYQASDRQNQCVWGAYTGQNKRALTVELRAIAGAAAAARTFKSERQADESGKGLLATQKLISKRGIPQLGEEAYVVYVVESNQNSGQAIVNVRYTNVLITVHYSGGSEKEALAEDPAIDGAIAAAKETVTVLSTSK